MRFNKLAAEKLAKTSRLTAVLMSDASSDRSHYGGGFSAIDIVSVLYSSVMNYDFENPKKEDRDIFILSKGHGVLCYYPVLAELGIINKDTLINTFNKNESDFMTHPVMNLDLGIESSNGSLGHGLSLAVGMALGARAKQLKRKHYVLLGNGECDEGSVWEAAMAASHFKLDSLTAIIDDNGLQSDGKSEDVLSVGDLAKMWRAFGWETLSCDGNDVEDVYRALTKKPEEAGKPRAIIAKTVKGKGLAFMEGNNEWHHNRLNKVQLEEALKTFNG